MALLEVSGLTAGYGRARVLFDVELELGAGEVVTLTGRNGAGKSTTLKAIMGLIARAGDLRFDATPLARLEAYEIVRLGLGYVPEDRRIFTGLTVAENLEVGRRAPRAGLPAWDEARVFALFPPLAAMKDRLGARMSGGEQKMLAIARTLMGNPRAVLLDEPSEGLAPLVVRQMAAALAELKRAGLSVLVCEQNAQFAARLADRAYAIERGRVRPA
ncbi:MAG TPA: ABC transporter ATP-binding protein [Burkholderiales bacterium]|nr:ABC transporter ATP-binding protein [Burkholderiales bacterium]